MTILNLFKYFKYSKVRIFLNYFRLVFLSDGPNLKNVALVKNYDVNIIITFLSSIKLWERVFFINNLE